MHHPKSRPIGGLLRAANRAPADLLAGAVAEGLSEFGVLDATLYVIDYDGRCLHPAPGRAPVRLPQIDLASDSEAGRAFTTGEPVQERIDACRHLWIAVRERTDTLGVLELVVDSLDEPLLELARDAGDLVGHLLVSAGHHTDAFELLRRKREMSLAAEMHWDMLPARTYSHPRAAVTADIEPAYEVGGDAYDYSLTSGFLEAGVLDAMGHGLKAALLSTQALCAYRYARRRGMSLIDVVSTIDDTMERQFDGASFVTGVFIHLDLQTRALSWASAGHLPPLLVRADNTIKTLEGEPSTPMGIGLLIPVPAHRATLEEGDRVILYSDGILEARSPQGEEMQLSGFVRQLGSLLESNGSRMELSRGVLDAVMTHVDAPLRDDATILIAQLGGV